MNKCELENDVEATIRVLRYLTGGQGDACIIIIEDKDGKGFTLAKVSVGLFRDGLDLSYTAHSPEELKRIIIGACNPFSNMELSEMNDLYTKK